MSFCLYRCYAADGDLLYVGQSSDPVGRMRHHACVREWWPEVERVVVCKSGFEREADARRAEAFAIAWEAPRENVHGAIRCRFAIRRAGGIRRVMKEQGRSMTWLARRIGVSRTTLYAWEGGLSPVPSWAAERAEALLGVPAADLFERLVPHDDEVEA